MHIHGTTWLPRCSFLLYNYLLSPWTRDRGQTEERRHHQPACERPGAESSSVQKSRAVLNGQANTCFWRHLGASSRALATVLNISSELILFFCYCLSAINVDGIAYSCTCNIRTLAARQSLQRMAHLGNQSTHWMCFQEVHDESESRDAPEVWLWESE